MRRYLVTCHLTLREAGDAQLLKGLAARLKALPHRPLVRVPIEWNEATGDMTEPVEYRKAFDTLAGRADLLIEFADSEAMAKLPPERYRKHVEHCIAVLGEYSAIGEAGNEINSDNWHKPGSPHPHPYEAVAPMVQSGLEACASAHLPTAITYYLGVNQKYAMNEWIEKFASKLESDFALVSHYPNSGSFTDKEMRKTWAEFAERAHAPVIGWGEYGTQDAAGAQHPKDAKKIVQLVEGHYWEMLGRLGKYAGFGGYWDWTTDSEIDAELKALWP
jgi:hypothetical protein